MEPKTLLYINADFVYPPNHGDRVDTWNRIQTLTSLGYEVDLVCTVKEKPQDTYINYVEQVVHKLYLCKRKNRIIDMFDKNPLQLVSRKRLADINFTRAYDFLFIDDTADIYILRNQTLKYRKALLHMNNDNVVYFKALANSEHNLFKKLYYWIESKKFKAIDRFVVKKIPNIAFVSDEERERYQKRYPQINAFFLPVAINLECKKRPLDNKTALIIGSLFMTNNRDAIEFYVSQVHPILSQRYKDYQLIVAGNSRGNSISWLYDKCKKYSNIKVYDSPDDLEAIYESGTVFVNPMRFGAGVKLKTVNAIINGLPVVSTTIGNEGTGLVDKRDIYIANTPEEMADRISDIFAMSPGDKERFIISAQKYLLNQYDQKKSLSEYLSNL